jgi:hypothetical protein
LEELGVKDKVSWLEVITELEEGEVFAGEELETMQDSGMANLSNKEKGSPPTPHVHDRKMLGDPHTTPKLLEEPCVAHGFKQGLEKVTFQLVFSCRKIERS